MHPSLIAALADAAPLVADRGWTAPAPATIAAAERLLTLVGKLPRQPAIQAEPNGTISFEWEAGDHGWLTLTVDDQGQLTHSAVLGEDEFTQAEAFGDTLPDWALFELYEQRVIGFEEAIRNADSANELRLNIKLRSRRGEPVAHGDGGLSLDLGEDAAPKADPVAEMRRQTEVRHKAEDEEMARLREKRRLAESTSQGR